MSTITFQTTEVPQLWPDILASLSIAHDEIVITDGVDVKAVLITPIHYRYLMQLAKRETQRQQALAIPLPAQESIEIWNAGFDTLEQVSEKFVALSDDELDDLFGQVLAEVRAA